MTVSLLALQQALLPEVQTTQPGPFGQSLVLDVLQGLVLGTEMVAKAQKRTRARMVVT